MMDFENIYFIVSGIAMMNFFISFLVFSQKTVHPIEKKIKEAAGELPQWDNMGVRIPSYAMALILPINVRAAQAVDEDLVQKFATKADRRRAKYFFHSGWFFILLAAIGYFTLN